MTTHEMHKLYQAGNTLAEVGSRAGLSPQGVWRRFRAAGLDIRPPGSTPRRTAEIAQRNELFIDMLGKGHSYRQVAEWWTKESGKKITEVGVYYACNKLEEKR